MYHFVCVLFLFMTAGHMLFKGLAHSKMAISLQLTSLQAIQDVDDKYIYIYFYFVFSSALLLHALIILACST